MRISVKMVLLVVCVSAGLVFGAAKGAKDVKVEPKDTKTAVKDANVPAKETTAVKTEVKETKPEVKPAAPAVKAPEPTAPKSAEEANSVAVTVNGTVITEGDVDAKIDTIMKRAAGQIPPGMVEQYKMQMRPQVVESLVMEKLLGDQINKAGIVITDSDVNNKLTEIIADQPGMTLESFKAMLAAQGQSFDEIKDRVKKTLGYEKLMGPVEVNDADAKAYYEANKEDFNKPEEVKASHILVKVAPTPESATPEQKAAAEAAKTAAKTKIDGLLKQVKEGADFATLAKENSDDPGLKVMGGDLGFFEKGAMVKEFADAAFATKVGQVSDVVETQYGYHIIKVTDHKTAGLTSFDIAKADIVKMLENKKKGEMFKQLVDKIKAAAKIEYPPGKEPKPRMPMMPRQNAPAPQTESAPAPK
jgi:parvulin-like peptidyl-prolyl isomerase